MPKPWHARLAGAVAIAAAVIACGAGTAGAQSPTPTLHMKDVAPGGAFPSGANAVVVEGLMHGAARAAVAAPANTPGREAIGKPAPATVAASCG